MPHNTLKIVLLVCSGLLIGAVMPFVEYVALFLIDLTVALIFQNFLHGAALGDPWLSIVFVLLEIISLFFMAKYNKILAGSALITAATGTALLLNFMWHFAGFV